jgi:hypothetical protein
MSAGPDSGALTGPQSPLPASPALHRPGIARARLVARAQRSLLPVRRMLSRVALVYEERHFRDLAIGAVYGALAAEARKIHDDMRWLEERIILRVDIVLEELWRRTEGVGARQATELQRLAARLSELQQSTAEQAPELARLATQMADVHRLATEVAEIRRSAGPGGGSPAVGGGPGPGGGGPAGPLLAELEHGFSPPPAQRVEPYLKYFEHMTPVLDLATGDGEFLRAAAAAGIEASASSGDASAHLRSLAPATLGGAFASHLMDGLPAEGVTELLAALRQALKPGGIAILEAANPASFAGYVTAVRTGARSLARSPEELAALANAAGLDVDECRYASPPGRHLAEVGAELTDPALREVAEGINGLVGQLNDLLYGPQSYALILRCPA